MPPKVKRTRQHTVGVDEELWNDCLAIAKVKRQNLSQVLRDRLVAYRADNLELLAEIKAAQPPATAPRDASEG